MESMPLKSISNPPPVGSGGQAVSSPCAGCKFLRRKCQSDCIFAPYFPPEQPQKFMNVHRVFGASNVSKILNDLSPYQREDAVSSLAYEAETHLREPVYGCVGVISLLQGRIRLLQNNLSRAKFELAKCYSALREMEIGQFQRQQRRIMLMSSYAAAAAAAAAEFGSLGPFGHPTAAEGDDSRLLGTVSQSCQL